MYTTGNLILLGNFTKSIHEPGFLVFYNPVTNSKADQLIKLDEENKYFGANEYANYIFSSSELAKFGNAALKGEAVDWTGMEKEYEKTLRKDFVHRNILDVRVQVLSRLARTDDKYIPDLIKYNIELIDTYGIDTTNGYLETTAINNFVFNDIFYHSNDPAHFEFALKWMEGSDSQASRRR